MDRRLTESIHIETVFYYSGTHPSSNRVSISILDRCLFRNARLTRPIYHLERRRPVTSLTDRFRTSILGRVDARRLRRPCSWPVTIASEVPRKQEPQQQTLIDKGTTCRVAIVTTTQGTLLYAVRFGLTYRFRSARWPIPGISFASYREGRCWGTRAGYLPPERKATCETRCTSNLDGALGEREYTLLFLGPLDADMIVAVFNLLAANRAPHRGRPTGTYNSRQLRTLGMSVLAFLLRGHSYPRHARQAGHLFHVQAWSRSSMVHM